MPITRAQADAKLISRCGPLLTLVGKDGTTVDGSNPDTVDALQVGMASLGLAPASFATVTDDDLAPIADAKVPQLIDVAELQLIQAVGSSFTDVDEKISLGEKKVSQNRAAIDVRFSSLAAFCRLRYGYGLAPLGVGSINTGMSPADSTTVPEI